MTSFTSSSNVTREPPYTHTLRQSDARRHLNDRTGVIWKQSTIYWCLLNAAAERDSKRGVKWMCVLRGGSDLFHLMLMSPVLKVGWSICTVVTQVPCSSRYFITDRRIVAVSTLTLCSGGLELDSLLRERGAGPSVFMAFLSSTK
jgi:hypothetical protein